MSAAPLPDAPQPLCRLDQVPDGTARGFDPGGAGEDTVFVIRRGERVYAYRNSCPHNGRPLEYMRHRFLTHDGTQIMCYAHAARFGIEDGVCTHGPCLGAALDALPVRVEQGEIFLDRRGPDD
ncbi:Rieske (2Fe-2S) protein [Massilia putida]|uniref:Rieske (2Fe-2S) protein n=1 Tax=Massilia putida TaxID=1141883 RepID=UPI001E5C1A86|nr:Rieske (2Fe-2S) protein [Massilia putida]